MADELLMKDLPEDQKAFDIHAGGLDLQFPHHENEIAQSTCAHPQGGFAKVWLHNEMLQVEGKKMSKSLGNFFTVRDLLDEQNVPGPVIRYMLLGTHYRKPMDWLGSRVEPIKKTLKRWASINCDPSTPDVEIIGALCDDLNTPLALGLLHRLEAQGEFAKLKASLSLLGIDLQGILDWPTKWGLSSAWDNLVGTLIAERERARLDKNFERADYLRNGLRDAGIEVRDLPTGPEWELSESFSLVKLEALK